ncbi:MAG TPA: tRNA uridine-5-carboxymethylaminomethyl(34) synthesis GTPase MnmE [Candidatus Dormibacteraeota bacterium]|nr:tRNA uridine-5-carboxymethylaminomethyl(34) synthesis GTPase MnmE [Candidatus Dormibacteraeota bacterium]
MATPNPYPRERAAPLAAGETIAALATPPGRGAIAIVRCSGCDVRRIAATIFRAASRGPLRSREVRFGRVVDPAGHTIDQAMALLLAAPATPTGEDVLELHLHGSPVVVRETLAAAMAAGARMALPGEFTRRAFLNGKLDLSQAEAVADLIEAEHRGAARAAEARLDGALRDAVRALRDPLDAALEELSASVDFPDEVPAPDPAALEALLQALREGVAELRASWEMGRLLREGLAAAIVGPPNAGKSSLLNALLGEERALVSAQAGTTRDTLDGQTVIDGVLVRLIDTAGLRRTDEAVEAAGIARARRAAAEASLLVVVLDGSQPLGEEGRAVLEQTNGRRRLLLFNKADAGDAGWKEWLEAPEVLGSETTIFGSVLRSADVEGVRRAIASLGWDDVAPDPARPHLASAWQAQAVEGALAAFDRALEVLRAGHPADVCVGDLVEASASLGQLSGEAVTEQLIESIFARFCIGK